MYLDLRINFLKFNFSSLKKKLCLTLPVTSFMEKSSVKNKKEKFFKSQLRKIAHVLQLFF